MSSEVFMFVQCLLCDFIGWVNAIDLLKFMVPTPWDGREIWSERDMRPPSTGPLLAKCKPGRLQQSRVAGIGARNHWRKENFSGKISHPGWL